VYGLKGEQNVKCWMLRW